MDICSDAIKLWNFTYVQGVHGLKQFSYRNNDEINLLDVSASAKEELRLKCYSGEPQLEKIMDDGEVEKVFEDFFLEFST